MSKNWTDRIIFCCSRESLALVPKTLGRAKGPKQASLGQASPRASPWVNSKKDASPEAGVINLGRIRHSLTARSEISENPLHPRPSMPPIARERIDEAPAAPHPPPAKLPSATKSNNSSFSGVGSLAAAASLSARVVTQREYVTPVVYQVLREYRVEFPIADSESGTGRTRTGLAPPKGFQIQSVCHI